MTSLDFNIEKQYFRDYYNESNKMLNDAKDTFILIINSILADNNYAISTVSGRVKDREECINKFNSKYKAELEENDIPYEIKDHLTDIVGLRVVCLYENDVEHIKNLLCEEFELIDLTDKIKTVESKEDSFGYKGLHVDLKLKEPRNNMLEYKRYSNIRFEVQIRTIVQDAWSVLDHKIKYKKSIPLKLKRRINTLAALFELADREFISIKEETTKVEETAKEEREQPSKTESINAFSFLAIIEDRFNEYRFNPNKIDSFVSEIIEYGHPNPITPLEFKSIMDAEFNIIEEYKAYLGKKDGERHALNPYTEIRHVLFKSDKEKYKNILYSDQRRRFEEWLSEK